MWPVKAFVLLQTALCSALADISSDISVKSAAASRRCSFLSPQTLVHRPKLCRSGMLKWRNKWPTWRNNLRWERLLCITALVTSSSIENTSHFTATFRTAASAPLALRSSVASLHMFWMAEGDRRRCRLRQSSGENGFSYHFKVENYVVPLYGKNILKMMWHYYKYAVFRPFLHHGVLLFSWRRISVYVSYSFVLHEFWKLRRVYLQQKFQHGYCVFHHQKNEADKKAVTGLKELQQELQRSAEECKRLREKLAKTEAELQTTVEEWVRSDRAGG